jgi:hypothetical protein
MKLSFRAALGFGSQLDSLPMRCVRHTAAVDGCYNVKFL